MCTARRKLFDCFVKWGFVGWVNGQLCKRVGFIRVLFGDHSAKAARAVAG